MVMSDIVAADGQKNKTLLRVLICLASCSDAATLEVRKVILGVSCTIDNKFI